MPAAHLVAFLEGGLHLPVSLVADLNVSGLVKRHFGSIQRSCRVVSALHAAREKLRDLFSHFLFGRAILLNVPLCPPALFAARLGRLSRRLVVLGNGNHGAVVARMAADKTVSFGVGYDHGRARRYSFSQFLDPGIVFSG